MISWLAHRKDFGVILVCVTTAMYVVWEYGRMSTAEQRAAAGRRISHGVEVVINDVAGRRLGARIVPRVLGFGRRLRWSHVAWLTLGLTVACVVLIGLRFLKVR
jgi:hypothetical protein